MIGIEQLKHRVDGLQPIARADGLTESQIAVAAMSDEELERRAREILGGNTDDLDQDLVRQARHISNRRVR